MAQINWEQFKTYKQQRPNPQGLDNFQLLYEFIRSYFNFSHLEDIYDTLSEDPLSRQMLEKRGIGNTLQLEEYMYAESRKTEKELYLQ